jgi:hypothetical protein
MYFRFIYLSWKKYLIKVELQKKLSYWHQSIIGNWFRKSDHRCPTSNRSQKPMKLNIKSKKIIQNVKKLKKE